MKKHVRETIKEKGLRKWVKGSPLTKTYFLQGEATGLVKIGRTVGTIEERLKEIQPLSPDTLRVLKVVNRNIEKECHETFKEHRMHYEWFRPAPILMLFIENID